MSKPEIVAHRGVPSEFPENTIPSFERAIELGADAIEFDVRLTSDGVPVVFHYFYLQEVTSGRGPIFAGSYEDVRRCHFLTEQGEADHSYFIPTLREVVEEMGDRTGLVIDLKGPEPEAATIVSAVLHEYRNQWDTIEVISYEPSLLLRIQEQCPGVATDLSIPRTDAWMGEDVISHMAIHRGRLAKARAVHLHPSQLTPAVLQTVHKSGLEIHSWDVNSEDDLRKVFALGIPKFDTEMLRRALELRSQLKS